MKESSTTDCLFRFYIVGGISSGGAAKTSMFSMSLPPVDNLEEVNRYRRYTYLCLYLLLFFE